MLRAIEGRVTPKAALMLGRLQFLAGGAGGVLGIGWFLVDTVRGLSQGNKKDAALDFVSVIGVVINTASLFFHGTIVGVPVGVVLNCVGFTLMLVAQLAKWLNWLDSELEDLCKDIYSKSVSEGGFGQFEKWEEEFKNVSIEFPIGLDLYNQRDSHEQLIKRVKEFITNIDAFDKVEDAGLT